jgi:hypothetical protein
MNGIGIQFLDGIGGLDIQFLDSTGTDNGIHGVFDKIKAKHAGKLLPKIPFQKLKNLSPEQQAQMKERIAKKLPFRRKLTPKLGQIYDFYTQGYTAQVADNIDTVLKGLDFAGFAGDGSIEDDEMLLNHLVRTKYIAEQAPQTIAGYQHPKMFNKMLGYVLDHWDTPDREAALDIVASEEERLMGLGAIIIPDHEDEQYEFMQGGIEGNLYNIDEYEVNGLGAVRTKTGKRGFFNNVRKLNSNAALTESARTLKNTTQNAFLRKKIGKNRNSILSRRKKVTKNTATAVPDITPEGVTPEQPEEKEITQEIAETPEVIEGLGSTYDNEEQFNYVLQGYDLVGTLGAISSADEDLQGMKEYFENTRNLLSGAPAEYFDSQEEARMAIGALDYITMNWDNPVTRDKTLGILSGEAMTDEQHETFIAGLGGFGDPSGLGFLKKIAKKVGGAVKKVAKATGKAVKTVAKTTAKVTKAVAKTTAKVTKAAVKTTVKATKAVAKATGKVIKKVAKAVGKAIKKVVKFIIKFNPLSLIIKGGILLAMRLNMFNFAKKLFPGMLTQQDAASRGISAEDWDKHKKAYDKCFKIYEKFGGSRSKFDSAIKKGGSKKWNGSDEFNKDAATAAGKEGEAEVNAEIAAEEAELKSKGATVTNDPNIMYSEEQAEVEVEVPENEAAVQGLMLNGYITENDGLGAVVTATIIAAAATALAAIGGVISSIIGKKTAQIQADAQNQSAQNNQGTAAFVDQYGNPIPLDENGQPVYNNGDYEYSAEDQMILTQIATDPDAFDNPVIQAALANNPALANSPIVQTAAINKAASANADTGMSTGAKIGIGIGGVLLLGTIAYFALSSSKKEEVKV